MKALQELKKWMDIDLNYLFKGGTWLGITHVTNIISGLLVSIVLARLFTKEQFGEYQFIIALVGMFSLLTIPGLNVSAIHSFTKGHTRSILTSTKERAIAGILGSIALLVVSAYFHFIRQHASWPFYLLLAAIFPLIYAGEPLYAALISRENFKQLSIRQSIASITPTLAVIIAALLTSSVYRVTFAFFLTQILIYAIYFLRDYHLYRTGTDEPGRLHFGIHLSLMNFLGYLQVYYDKLLVTYFFGFATTALYGIAAAISDQLYAVSKLVIQLVYARLVKLERNVAYTLVRKHLLKLALFFIALGIIAIFLAPPFIKIVYTTKYADAILLAQAFLGVSVLRSIGYIFFRSIEAQRETKKLYLINTTYFAVELITTIILVPTYRLWGFVIAQAASNVWFVALSAHAIFAKKR